MEWGQGLGGEHLPEMGGCPATIAGDVSTGRRTARRDAEAEAAAAEFSEGSRAVGGAGGRAGSLERRLPAPRFLRGARLRLTSVACGGGHVIAAVGGGGVVCWGGGVLASMEELGVQQVKRNLASARQLNPIVSFSLSLAFVFLKKMFCSLTRCLQRKSNLSCFSVFFSV